MSLDDINDSLLSGGPIIKLEVGETVTAVIVGAEKRPKTDMATGEVLRWDDGRVKEQLVLTVRRDGADEDERIFLKPTAEKALSRWLKDHNQRLAIGGRIGLRRLDDIAPSKRGWAPAQDYAVEYAPPVAQPSGGGASILG